MGTKVSKKTAAKTEDGLTLMQEEFCQLYINADRELFGNGVQCYLNTFGEQYFEEKKKRMKYEVACVLASKELSKVKVIERINQLLQTGGFNDENIDKQHLFLINQHADLKTKMAAIREYNQLKKRVSPGVGNQLNIVFMPLELMQKHNIKVHEATPSTEPNSTEHQQIQGS